MTNLKTTKRALISSVVALFVCFAMLLGTTFAWFTDEATSSGNIIQSGKLDVNMYWAEGNLDPEAAETQWTEAKSGPIFNNDKWEPGYVEAKHIKIANEGTLALKYQMRILANGIVSELADVIDVYYFYEIEEGNEEDLTGAVQLNRASFTEANRLGTLSEVLNVTYANNISTKISGTLEEDTFKTLTLAFKMQETAGNEYQDMSLGSEFTIQILATQYTSESDSFDNTYDKDADFAPQETPTAMVYALSKTKLQSITIGGINNSATLDTGYSFQPSETYAQALESEYSWAHADFYVYADNTVPANSMVLAGYYSAFEGFSYGGQTLSDTTWIGLASDVDIPANQGIRLIADGMNGGVTNSGITIPYNAICELGNDGVGFLCGAADLTGANEGTTLTVELRLYKTYTPEEAEELGFGNTKNQETGEYITVGTFTYTFGGSYTTLDDGSEVFMADDGDITLTDVSNVTATEYYIPDGVTTLDSMVFSQNSNITSVVISDTVTDFGATNVTSTGAYNGAFKDSNVNTIILPEGMTEIPAAAFSGAKQLTSVNIPSSVETIGVWAFRETALTELTVPATVKEIKYGAFRTMSALEKVIVEGSPIIEKYAFRECSALTEVYLLGDDVTFPMTGQHFTKDQTGIATGITVYVANATVAARIYAAAADDIKNGLVVKVGDENSSTTVDNASNNDTLSEAISGGASTVVLSAGTYAVPASAVAGKDVTIVGTGDNTVFDFTTNYGVSDANITFENLKITGVNSNTMNGYGIQSTTGEVVYKNCTFENAMTSEFYGNVSYIDCTFVGTYYIATYAVDSATFEGCTFDRTDSRALLVYSHGDNPVNVTVRNCTFTADAKAYTYSGDWTAAIEVDTTNIPTAGTTVTIENCTYNEYYNGLVRDKSTVGKENAVITVDGNVVDNTTIKTTGYSLNG